MSKNFKAILLCFLVFILLLNLISCKEEPDVHIKFFENDSAALTSLSRAVLINVSINDAKAVTKYLKSEKVELVDALIMGDMSADILEGSSHILKNTDVDKIYTSADIPENEAYDGFLEALDEAAIDPYCVEGSLSFGAGDTSIRVYASVDDPEASLITRIVCNKKAFLFLGGADDKRIFEFMRYDENKYDLIKLSYDGETGSALSELIEKAGPDILICAKDSPDQKDIAKKAKCDIYELNKDICFECNGKRIKKV